MYDYSTVLSEPLSIGNTTFVFVGVIQRCCVLLPILYCLESQLPAFFSQGVDLKGCPTFFSAAPAGPPQDVMALTQSPTSILITWSPPLALDRNGIITRYIVKYNLSSDVEANISTLDNSTQIVVTNLKKYSSYYFTVQAENKIGVGPSSVAVVNTTLEDGKFPPYFKRYQQIA